MSAFSSSLRFLHCLRHLDRLQQALSTGVRFTGHPVAFRPADSHDHWSVLLGDLLPLLLSKLQQLGLPWESLSEDRRRAIVLGLGSVSAEIPMICFTEVPDGRSTAMHHYQYGRYGLVVKREWLELNNADRVLYVGDMSAVSKRVFRLVAAANILGMHAPAGQPLFDNFTMRAALDLIAYVENRQNLEEFEWRIAGRHGLMGGPRDTDTRLPLPLSFVETVFVSDEAELDDMKALVASLASAQAVKHSPEVRCSDQAAA